MKTISLATVFLAVMPFAAHASTLLFPSGKPVATVSIPDSWGPKLTESGIDATSPDTTVYFAIDVADNASIEKVVGSAVDFLTQNGVRVDQSTKAENDIGTVNGMRTATIDWQGTDKDGPVDVTLAVLAVSDSKTLVVTYWGQEDVDNRHDVEIQNILASLGPAK